MNETCPICGNEKNNRSHAAREMMFGTGHPFTYLECGDCGTISLLSVPNLSEYYPPDYYSFRDTTIDLRASRKRRFAARLAGRFLMTGRGFIGRRIARSSPFITEQFPSYLRAPMLGLSFSTRILDYGSGSGELLRRLNVFGFRSLTGADKYISSNRYIDRNVRLLKADLTEISDEFDLVMLNHSFEHLTQPKQALAEIRRILAADGTCLIRIPVVNYAWEKYGVDWVQLDPPRHIFLYTERSFRDLTQSLGFEVVKVVYDSTIFQFHGSEQYKMGIPMNDPRSFAGVNETSIFDQAEINEWQAESERLNAEGRGDQACFYLKKRD